MKIAYCAGHDLSTPGKRVPAALDDAETREWVLNDRVADGLAQAALAYPELQLLRTDDPLGLTTVPIAKRAQKANAWGADLYLDLHHNAGIDLGKGGGLTVFCYPGSAQGRQYRDAVYEALLAAGAPRGNRSQPLREKKFLSLSKTKMPALLIEYGFMDSVTDWQLLSREDFGARMGKATLEAVARLWGLRKTVTVSAKKNNRHPLVKTAQLRLRQLGYSQVGEPDGIAGPKFTAAVKAFQRDHGCVVDGELTAGCRTWRELMKDA